MTGKVVTVANRKGGVGKTTLTVMLADCLNAAHAKRVCVVDTDPQGSTTQAFLTPKMVKDGATQRLFLERTLFGKALHGRIKKDAKLFLEQVSFRPNCPDVPLSLVPISPKYWEMEDRIISTSTAFRDHKKMVRGRMERLLTHLASHFDYILVDTPPGWSLLNHTVLKKSDLILAPSPKSRMGVWGLDVFERELSKLGLLDRANWIWTMVISNQNPGEDFRNFMETTRIQSIRNVADERAVAGTDINNLLEIPMRVAVQQLTNPGDRGPWPDPLPEDVEKIVSKLATYVMRTLETKHEH